MSAKHLILWDGDCGFCRRSVTWALAHDRTGELDAMPYQVAAIPAQLSAQCAKAVHVMTSGGDVLRGGRACLFVLEQTAFRPAAKLLGKLLLVWLVELAYRVVARARTRKSQCGRTRRAPLADGDSR